MQEVIKQAQEQFEAIADAFNGGTQEDEVTKPKTHQRAGFTKNHGRGQGKARRKMAAMSRRRNRAA